MGNVKKKKTPKKVAPRRKKEDAKDRVARSRRKAAVGLTGQTDTKSPDYKAGYSAGYGDCLKAWNASYDLLSGFGNGGG